MTLISKSSSQVNCNVGGWTYLTGGERNTAGSMAWGGGEINPGASHGGIYHENWMRLVHGVCIGGC